MSMTVNLKEGQVISGTVTITARVQTPNLVTNVEFYVNESLRSTDDSTPYELRIDTIDETEGPIRLEIAAYDNQGNSVKQKFNLRIDNGLGQGIDFHVNRAQEAIVDAKWDAAIEASRVALKIDGKNNKARMAMARANFGKGVLDLAQKFTEDVLSEEPANSDALALNAAINLRRAFVSSAGTDEGVAVVRGALRAAAQAQARVLQGRADAFGSLTSDNLISYADAMIAAHRYGAAAQALRPRFDADQRDGEVADRLVFSLIRMGRFTEATRALTLHERFGSPSGYAFILKAILLQAAGQGAQSEEAEKEAILNDPTNRGVRYGQAFLALSRNRVAVLRPFVNDFVRTEPTNPQANYYAAVIGFLGNDFEASRQAFQRGMLADPANYDLLVERGHQIMASAFTQQLTGEPARVRFDLAAAYYEAALEARPESFEALSALSLSLTLQGKAEDAIRFGRAAVAAAPEYAGSHYALSAALRAGRQVEASGAAQRRAGELDRRLVGAGIPQPVNVWRYLYTQGRVPVIPAPRTASN